MSNIWRIAIVVLLVVVVIGAVSLKSEKKADDSGSAVQPEVSTSQSASLPKLLDLGADKCIPCKKMIPILDSLQEEYKGKLEVEFIDVWKNPDAKKEYNIKLIPTQIFYDSKGNELFRHEGFYPKADIIAKFKELGINL